MIITGTCNNDQFPRDPKMFSKTTVTRGEMHWKDPKSLKGFSI